MTTIQLYAVDQALKIIDKPMVTSGNKESVSLYVRFSAEWSEYQKSAVFFTSRDETVYEMLLDDGKCIVPHEVLEETGCLFIGVRGVKSSDVPTKTSALVKYKIEKGAPVGTGTVVEPTSDVYQQILARIDAGLLRGPQGPKGDKGDPGSVMSVNGMAPDANGNVEVEGGVSVTAAVGQTIVVEEVDENGKPTKWKAADFQERTHWTEEVVILEETTLVPSDDESLMFAALATPDVGDICKVTYNGTEYTCKAVNGFAMVGMECVLLGNLDLAMGTGDTGEPFLLLIAMAGEGGGQLLPLDTSETFTLSIKGEAVTKIPEKYIPCAPIYVNCNQGEAVNDYIPNISVTALESLIDAERTVIMKVPIYGSVIYYAHFGGEITDDDGKRRLAFFCVGYGLTLIPQDDNTYIGEFSSIN